MYVDQIFLIFLTELAAIFSPFQQKEQLQEINLLNGLNYDNGYTSTEDLFIFLNIYFKK
jgi:hypothetical protein